MAINGRSSDLLSPKQRRAIIALLTSRNVQEAAIKAKVGKRTLHRWLTKPEFLAALLEAEEEAIDKATRRLIGLQEEAIETIQAVMNDKEATHTVRLRAAQTILEHSLKLRELRNIEVRLTQLEVNEHDRQTNYSED